MLYVIPVITPNDFDRETRNSLPWNSFNCFRQELYGFISSDSSYMELTKTEPGWTIGGSNPGRGEIFRIRPDRPWSPTSLLQNGYRVSFPGVKRP